MFSIFSAQQSVGVTEAPHFPFSVSVTISAAKLRKEFIAGGIAGGIGVFIGFPMDLIKVKLQAHPGKYFSSFDCFKDTIKHNGVKALFHGCIPPTVTQGFLNALLFAGESTAMQFLQPNLKHNDAGTHLNSFVAGSFGGLCQSIVLVPTDVVKCSMQSHISSEVTKGFYHETSLAVKKIIHSDGIRGFYKGYFATLLRDLPGTGVYFFAYKNIRAEIIAYQNKSKKVTYWEWLFPHKQKPSDAITLVAGGLAGAASWAITYPIDVMKTHIQISTMPIEPDKFAYKDMPLRHVASSLYRRHGARIFVNGMGITILRAFPVNAAVFLVYEKVCEYLKL